MYVTLCIYKINSCYLASVFVKLRYIHTYMQRYNYNIICTYVCTSMYYGGIQFRNSGGGGGEGRGEECPSRLYTQFPLVSYTQEPRPYPGPGGRTSDHKRTSELHSYTHTYIAQRYTCTHRQFRDIHTHIDSLEIYIRRHNTYIYKLETYMHTHIVQRYTYKYTYVHRHNTYIHS